MLSLNDPMILREIIMDHYQNPRNRGLVDDDSYKKVNMNSYTCIDNLDIQVKLDGDMIEDIRYDGEACAISTASTSKLYLSVSSFIMQTAKQLKIICILGTA